MLHRCPTPAIRSFARALAQGERPGIAVAIAFVGVALAALSFADFGASGRALVGAVLCPVLILLAAIDARHKLLPNEIVLWSALLVALVVAATNPAGFLEHLWAGLAL